MPDRAKTAAILLIIGGAIILVGGVLSASAGSFISHLNSTTIVGYQNNLTSSLPPSYANNSTFVRQLGGLTEGVGIAGLAFGLIIIVLGALIYTKQERIKLFSAITLILGVLSLADLGGFVIGFLLVLIGSILGLLYKPGTKQAKQG